jgi:protein TorT
LTVLEAGGYTEIGTQVDQIDNCVASGADAILLGAVSNEALNAKIEEVVDAGVVVIDLINGVNTDRVAGRALFNYCLMGGNLGGYLASTGESVNAVWFPGPVGVGALEQLMSCFREQAEGSNVKLLGVLYGDTNKDDQLRLVENSFGAYPDMDYIVGSAVTVEAAIGPLGERGLSDEIRSASYYFTPGVYELIKSGDASCASTGHDIIMARIAVDLAIRKLEGVPFIGGYKHIGPDPLVVCGPGAGEAANNLDTFVEATTLPPDGFRPVFSYQP